jgi:thioredoxin 1
MKISFNIISLFLSVVMFGQLADSIKINSAITLKQYNKIVNSTGKPILAYFSADWCSVSVNMNLVIENIEKELGNKIQILKINTERDKELNDYFEINTLPLLLFYKNGIEKWRNFGLISANEICTKIEPYLE